MADDFVTILRAEPPSRLLTKQYRQGPHTLEKIPYDRVTWFRVSSRTVASLDDLEVLLRDLSGRSNLCVIRDRLRPREEIIAADAFRKEHLADLDEDAGKPYVSKTKAGKTAYRRAAAIFADAPHRWVAFDVDDWTPPRPIDDLEDLVETYIRKTLPAPFRGVDVVVQLTSSHGMKPGLCARLWFWLDEPVSSAEWYAWGRPRKTLDAAVFRPVQVHYTAAPIFDGLDDPAPVRILRFDGVHAGEVCVHDLNLPDVDDTDRGRPDVGDGSDAREKPGVVGAFNRAFPITRLIDEELGDIFRHDGGNRVTFLDSASQAPGGCKILDDDTRLFNSHASDPRRGAPANAFELLATHRFDDDVEATIAWITAEHPEVLEDVAPAGEDFDEMPDTEETRAFFTDDFSGPDTPSWVRDLNRTYAAVKEAGRFFIVELRRNPSDRSVEYVYGTESAFIASYRNVKTRKKTMGEAWLLHSDRRQYLGGTTYMPNPAPGTVPDDVLNTWIRPRWTTGTLPAASEAAVAPWMALVRDIFDNDEGAVAYFMQRAAALVQRPEEKRNSALIVGGAERIGKNTMLRPIEYGVGYENTRHVSPGDLEGDFNWWLFARKLIVLEELKHANRWDITNRLKNLIAAPPYTIALNRKGIPQIEIPNIAEYIGMTNHDDALAISGHGDRYWIWFSKFTRDGFETRHRGILPWLENEANLRACVAWLNAVDVDWELVNGPPPMTDAKRQMIVSGRTGLEAEIEELWESRAPVFDPDLFTVRDVLDALPDPRHKASESHPSIGALLEELGARKLGRKDLYVSVPNGRRYNRVTVWCARRSEMYEGVPIEKLRTLFLKQRTEALQKAVAAAFD